MFDKLMSGLLNPHKFVLVPWKYFGAGSFKKRLDYDVFDRPHYAYCLYHGARLASILGLERISVAEFGVAGGDGLLALERLAVEIEKEFAVSIDIYGFDTGEGLPEPVDYRDLPYIWKAGFYKMDQDALRAKLKRSKLVLGDVKDTVPVFVQEHDPAPLVAAFFDLDFWSSTVDAFKIFDAPHNRILPRTFCYCDDVVSTEFGGLLNEYVGQPAAIRDYNQAHTNQKLTQIGGFKWSRRIPSVWNDKIYVHHTFDHPDYNTYTYPDSNRQLGLKNRE